MNTLEMIIDAKNTGKTYINNDLLYSDDKGFHDDTGGSWPAKSFHTLNDIIYLDGWKSVENN